MREDMLDSRSSAAMRKWSGIECGFTVKISPRFATQLMERQASRQACHYPVCELERPRQIARATKAMPRRVSLAFFAGLTGKASTVPAAKAVQWLENGQG